MPNIFQQSPTSLVSKHLHHERRPSMPPFFFHWMLHFAESLVNQPFVMSQVLNLPWGAKHMDGPTKQQFCQEAKIQCLCKVRHEKHKYLNGQIIGLFNYLMSNQWRKNRFEKNLISFISDRKSSPNALLCTLRMHNYIIIIFFNSFHIFNYFIHREQN